MSHRVIGFEENGAPLTLILVAGPGTKGFNHLTVGMKSIAELSAAAQVLGQAFYHAQNMRRVEPLPGIVDPGTGRAYGS